MCVSLFVCMYAWDREVDRGREWECVYVFNKRLFMKVGKKTRQIFVPPNFRKRVFCYAFVGKQICGKDDKVTSKSKQQKRICKNEGRTSKKVLMFTKSKRKKTCLAKMDSQHKHVMFFNVVHLCGKKGKSFF